MSSEVKKIISKDKINYNKLKSMLLYEFDSSFDDLIQSIIDILKNNKKKISVIFNIINFLDDNFSLLDKEKKDYVVIKCLELKEYIDNKDIMSRLDRFLNDVYYENSDKYKFDMGNFLEYLIYNDKSIRRIKLFLLSLDKSFFNSEQYNEIIMNLFKHFNTTDRDIKKYYYEVSILLLEKIGSGLLSKKKKEYLTILDELNVHSEYTDDLVSLVGGKNISSDTLISRFGHSFSFPYDEKKISIISNKPKDIPRLKQGAITIDNNSTLKMDDAIYLKNNRDNTYTLFVHVTFVPSLISFDSIVNKEAMKRYKSLYAFERVIPIIPDDLTLNKFSLWKNIYRDVVSYSVRLDMDMNIIPSSLRIERANVKVVENYSYDMADLIIKSNYDNDIAQMIKKLAVFSLKCDNDIDVDRALYDHDYFNSLLGENTSRDMIHNIMRIINHYSAKYFADRELPYLFKYTYFNNDGYSNFMKEVNNNPSLLRYDGILNDFKGSFFNIMLSEEAKSFFDFDCYSSSTDPLWKYSSLYNQYLINNFIFCKKSETNSKEEWYNRTRALAKEMNYKKQENKDIETVCKSLSRIRSNIRK